MEVGRYYLRKKAYVASITYRFKTVVQKYQTTSGTPEALYRLTEAYYALGVQSEAQTAAAVLGHNYPNSQWYRMPIHCCRPAASRPRRKAILDDKAIGAVNPF